LNAYWYCKVKPTTITIDFKEEVMLKRATPLGAIVLLALMWGASLAWAGTESILVIKPSLESADNYKGIKMGKLFLVNLEIANNSNNECAVGDDFRVLMKKGASEWNQFAMAANGPTQLRTENVRELMYGSGSGTIAQWGEGKQSLVMCFGGPNILHDKSAGERNADMAQWWPAKIASKGTATLKWPILWFTDTNDNPEYVASPVFKMNEKRYVYWVSFNGAESREIPLETKPLLEIINNPGESPDLRAASVRWLLEANQDNEKDLLPILQDAQAPKTLAYRAMQALVIWGSSGSIDSFYELWKNKKLSPALDNNNAPAYFTWSKYDKEKQYSEKMKAGKR
jgi:hypothetical protein